MASAPTPAWCGAKMKQVATQHQLFEQARRDLAATNEQFMDLVNHPTNPMTREDLTANIARRPALWGRYAGFLKTLPSKESK